jgi:hypothetical protein
MQKRVIRIIMGSSTDCCWKLFKKLKILPLQSQYVFSLLLFVVNNKDECIVNTKQGTDLHLAQTNLAVHPKGVYCLNIKIFNHLLSDIKNISNKQKKIQNSLKKFLTYKFLLFIRGIL